MLTPAACYDPQGAHGSGDEAARDQPCHRSSPCRVPCQHGRFAGICIHFEDACMLDAPNCLCCPFSISSMHLAVCVSSFSSVYGCRLSGKPHSTPRMSGPSHSSSRPCMPTGLAGVAHSGTFKSKRHGRHRGGSKHGSARAREGSPRGRQGSVRGRGRCCGGRPVGAHEAVGSACSAAARAWGSRGCHGTSRQQRW